VIKALAEGVGLGVVVSVLVVAGCAAEAPATGSSAGQTRSDGATDSTTGVAIDFRSEPDPLRSGDNTIEVTVRQKDGSPITDADVTAVFSMPAMPTMNMPAMRSEARLTHVEGGQYRGTGQLSMSGTWNVTVTATRKGEPVGRRTFSIVAK
jgi:nitrogen fixation protein FixH